MLKLITKHDEPFVTREDLHCNLRLSGSGENDYLSTLAETACQVIQEMSGKRLNVDVYEYITASAGLTTVLPLTPVSEVVSAVYFDASNASQTVSLTDLDITIEENSTTIKYNWPSVYDRKDAITIQFKTGYPDHILSAENLKHAAILLGSHWYENRTAANVVMHEIPYGVESLVNLSKIGWY